MTQEKEINIVALEFPQGPRLRTGMYLGSTENPDVCLREVIDNSVDELYNSISCDTIDVQIKSGKEGNYYVVADNGRGIPIIMDNDKGITKTELAMTVINAGSKFRNDASSVSIGSNGTGASCVNATSSVFIMLSKITDKNYDRSIEEVKSLWESNPSDEPFYVIEFHEGIKTFEGADVKSNIESKYGFTFPEKMSTVTAFKPDPTIWKSTQANYNKRALSYLQVILKRFYNKEAHIVIDGVEGVSFYEPYQFEFLKEIELEGFRKDDNGNIIPRTAKFYVNFDVDKDLSVCEQTGSINSLIVNRGLHINWAYEAYQKALKQFYELNHDYAWCGLKLNVICLSSLVDFSSQTKERCVKINDLVKDEVLPGLIYEFKQVFKKNKDYFDNHIVRLNEYAASLNKISAINKVKAAIGTVDGGNRVRAKIPANVRDAASNNRSECELFVVEGKSAGSTLIKARDPKIHAILPLRGVPMSTINADLDRIMDNEEMAGLITAIGAGVNEYFNIKSARYGKIILAGDADTDGYHINSMILGTIAKKMTFLIDDGRVFIASTPLYIQGDKKAYVGEDPHAIIDFSKPFIRAKGHGELNVKEAKELFFNTSTRRLIQITNNNLEYVFDMLSDSSTRKDLMLSSKVLIDKYGTGIL